MRKVILWSILVVVVAGSAVAQGWKRTLGGQGIPIATYDLARTPDGGYLMTAYIIHQNPFTIQSLLRLDAEGAVMWTYNFDIGVNETGPVVVHGNHDIFTVASNHLYKFSANGQVQFILPRDSLVDQVFGLMPDGIMTRSTWIDHDSFFSIAVQKHDFNGMRQWDKEYRFSTAVSDVKVAPDNKIWVVGKDSIYIFSSDGILQKAIDAGASYGKIAFDNAGNTLLMGARILKLTEPTQVFLKKISTDGTVLWSTTSTIAPGDFPKEYLHMPDGGFVLIGRIQNQPFNTLTLYGLNASGNTSWERKITTMEEPELRSAVVHPDGSFTACGSIYEDNGIIIWKFNADGLIAPNLLQGRLVTDLTGDCIPQGSEPASAGHIVQLEDQFYLTGSDGHFEFQADSGASTLQIFPPSTDWEVCPGYTTINFNGSHQTQTVDIPVAPPQECPQMNVSIGFNRLRRCFSNTATVNWCNHGTLASTDTRILVVLPPELDFEGATWPVSQVADDSLWFDIGLVEINGCGSFQLQATVNCDATVLGQALCTEAHIYPDTFCTRPANWSGAHVQVTAACIGDTLVEFHLKNTGDAATSPGLNYIIIEDQVVLMAAPFTLPPLGEVVIPKKIGSGSMYRLEADQEPFHPGYSMPAAWVEGCGTAPNQGLSLQYPADDRDLSVDIDCQSVIGSYDPNDKIAHPTGYDAAHLIKPTSDLTYKIRFQNTGTDTAYTVVVRDTLAEWLDPATVRPEAASHPYSWNFADGHVLKCTFDDIRLPDSTTNAPGSQGFVQFRVALKKDVPLGTVVYNDAAIYFDFNPPVITNETWHTVGQKFVKVNTSDPAGTASLLTMSPNPFRENAILQSGTELRGLLSVYTMQGQLLRQETVSGHNHVFKRQALPAGLYTFDIRDHGRLLGRGKMVILY